MIFSIASKDMLVHYVKIAIILVLFGVIKYLVKAESLVVKIALILQLL